MTVGRGYSKGKFCQWTNSSNVQCNVSVFFFQSTKGQRYRFSVIVNELKNAESSSYKATCLAFINSIIIASEQFDERVRIRNEFIGKFNCRISILVFFTKDKVTFTVKNCNC